MKKVVTTITAAVFALGLASAGLAQTTQTPAKPEVKKEAGTVQTPAAKPEVTKPEAAKPEVTKPEAVKSETVKPGEKAGAKEAVKPGEAKKDTKKDVKKAKDEKKAAAPMEKPLPEKK